MGDLPGRLNPEFGLSWQSALFPGHPFVMNTISLFLSVAALATPSVAQDVIGVGWSGEVYEIDLATGSSSVLGSSGYSKLNAMAKSPDGTMYAMSDGELLSIDPVTGLASFVASTTLNSVRGLAFDSAGTLYAAENPNATAIDEDILYTIDVGTGATTYIGATGFFGIQGMSFSGNVLYAFDIGNGSGFGDGLITIDPATAVATDVNSAVGGSGSEAQCLFTDNAGNLFCAAGELFSVNKTTGVITLIGGGGFSVRGAEVVGTAGPILSVNNLTAGQTATIAVSNAGQFGIVFAGYSLQGAGPTTIGTPWGSFDFALTLPVRRMPPFFADANGDASMTQFVPAGGAGLPVWMHALVLNSNGTAAELTNSLALTIQ